MTQYEAEAMLHILKRRLADEKNSVEYAYKMDCDKAEADRKHAMQRLEARLLEAQNKLSEAKDRLFNAQKDTEDWKLLAMEKNAAQSALREIYNEMGDLRRYYQGVSRDLLNKRDSAFRSLITEYGQERARILDKVEYTEREDKAAYWKAKYYKLKEEMEKQKEEAA